MIRKSVLTHSLPRKTGRGLKESFCPSYAVHPLISNDGEGEAVKCQMVLE